MNRINLDRPLPKFSSLVCGGNVLTGVVDGDWLIVDTLWPYSDLSGVSRETTPWWVQYATVAQLDGDVIRFPQLGGADVPTVVLASRVVRFPMSGLVEVLEVPSPYRP